MSPSQRLLVGFEPDEDSRRAVDALPMDELCGNVDMICDSHYLRIGQFAGAVLLLPTISELATAVLKLRRGDSYVEAQIIGDSPSLWFVSRKHGSVKGIAIVYRDAEIGILSRDEVDAAFEHGVEDFIRALHATRPMSSWGRVGHEVSASVAVCWPNLLPRAGVEAAI